MSGLRLRGVGVSPGVAWAPAVVVRFEFPNVPDRTVEPEAVEGEVRRLREAADAVVADLEELGRRVLQRAGAEEARIFDAQIMMVRDLDFLGSVEHLIRTSMLAAETAYEFKALEQRNLWTSSQSAMLRDRLADLNAVQLRMLHRLMGLPEPALVADSKHEQVIVVTRELSPGLTVQLDREYVVGVVAEEGTRTSHAAILAHSLGIPAVFGAPGALDRIGEGMMLLLDGTSGSVIVEPSRAELQEAKARWARRQRLDLQMEADLELPAETPDGVVVALRGNIDLPDEIDAAVRLGAEGVGLLRTEFLLTGRAELPGEDEQVGYFRRVGRAFSGRPVVIRAYDLGGDKFPAAFRTTAEANPFLGWRSIRVCLDQPEVFLPQLRAVLRAAADCDLRLMLPLVIDADEVRRTRELLREAAAQLHAEGLPAAASLPVGVMIETPAAVLIADRLAEVADFFSVGSNDLTQYTLAVDRGNARLADRFSALHPAVLRQLEQVVRAGQEHGRPVSVCGEMASDPVCAVLLLGMGYRELSVAAPSLPLVKWVLRRVPASAARRAVEVAHGAPSERELRAAVGRIIGDFVDIGLLDPAAALPPRTGAASLPEAPLA